MASGLCLRLLGFWSVPKAIAVSMLVAPYTTQAQQRHLLCRPCHGDETSTPARRRCNKTALKARTIPQIMQLG
eukprot:5869714-Amphidinium_carterae.1